MTSHSFISYTNPQFFAPNWQTGISIFRAGGVSSFHAFNELITARVRAGIGDNYEVRMKLHPQGRFVQWMECTCQANRRKAEKCGHLAAFCIYLDQEKSDYLSKMNFSLNESDDYLTQTNDFLKSNVTEDNKKFDVDLKEKKKIISDAKAILENNHLENIFSSPSTEILSITLNKELPWLNVHVKIDNNKKLNYRFGVDDTFRLLLNNDYVQKTSKEVLKLFQNGATAKRYFEVKNSVNDSFIIQKCVSLLKKDGKTKNIIFSEIDSNYIGRHGLFIENIGFVLFSDKMTPMQISRWNEYPKSAIVEGDTAATLIEDNFSRLKETAEIVIQSELSSAKVFQKLSISELNLNKDRDGSILINAKFGTESDDDDTNDIAGTLLQILRARAEGKKFLKTEKGFVKVTQEFDWLQNKVQNDGQIKLSTLDFIRFHEQFATGKELKGKFEIVDRIRAGLISRESLEMPSLSGSLLNLRPYQEDGLKWLWWLYNNNLGGLLADEMGLGKTHQAMGLISSISNKEQSSITLVVCPTSVIDHWLDKMNMFIPGVQVICYHGVARKNNFQRIQNSRNEHFVFITSYGILLRDIQYIMQYRWNVVILDEAHLVKNQSTRTYRAACKIESSMRLCLTGTPLENDLLELKNLFDYIAPGYLGSDSEFKKKYTVPSENQDPFVDIQLHRLIHPFKMRRNKIDVLTDLPEKVEDIRHCHLNFAQKKLYNKILNLKGSKLINELQDDRMPVPYIHIFSLITLLKQVCNDPAILDPKYENVGSGKLQVFDELLSEALESNQKVVVFTQYARMVARISSRLNAQGIKHVTLTGQSIKRGSIVKEFQENNDVKVFVGSLLAGGTGIDLTSASVVIHFDRWWNAAKENQATDRIHRIGQVRNVQVYKLITRGTLEERIDAIISRKKMIFERFVEQDEQVFKNLTRDDLLMLLKTPMDTEDSNLLEEEETHSMEL